MKKIFKMLTMVLSFLMVLSHVAMAAPADITVYVDDELTALTDVNGKPVYPFIKDGTTYVPLRGISQALDCVVEWDGANKTILIYDEIEPDNKVFRNNSDEIKLYVDNEEKTLYDANGTEVKPFIKDGTTYVPIRGVSQVLGCWVRWNGQNRTVKVYMDICLPDGVTLSENKPYETNMETYYELDGSQLEMDDIRYTNSLLDHYGGYALFNLDSKFKRMTFVAVPLDCYDDSTLNFIVDGKIVVTHIIEKDSKATKIEVPLNNGLQLKIATESYRRIGMGNIIFWGE